MDGVCLFFNTKQADNRLSQGIRREVFILRYTLSSKKWVLLLATQSVVYRQRTNVYRNCGWTTLPTLSIGRRLRTLHAIVCLNKVCAIDRIHPSHDDSKSVMQASIVSVRVTVR